MMGTRGQLIKPRWRGQGVSQGQACCQEPRGKKNGQEAGGQEESVKEGGFCQAPSQEEGTGTGTGDEGRSQDDPPGGIQEGATGRRVAERNGDLVAWNNTRTETQRKRQRPHYLVERIEGH